MINCGEQLCIKNCGQTGHSSSPYLTMPSPIACNVRFSHNTCVTDGDRRRQTTDDTSYQKLDLTVGQNTNLFRRFCLQHFLNVLCTYRYRNYITKGLIVGLLYCIVLYVHNQYKKLIKFAQVSSSERQQVSAARRLHAFRRILLLHS